VHDVGARLLAVMGDFISYVRDLYLIDSFTPCLKEKILLSKDGFLQKVSSSLDRTALFLLYKNQRKNQRKNHRRNQRNNQRMRFS